MQHAAALAALATAHPVITLARKPFADALARVCKVVQKRYTIPVLGTVRIRGDGSSIAISGTDLDHEMVVYVPAEVVGRFDVCAPAHLLLSLLKKAKPSDTVLMRETVKPVSERIVPNSGEPYNRVTPGTVKVVFGTPSYELQTLDVSDFPELAAPKEGVCFDVPAADLFYMLDKTNFAISSEETRYYLNGVYFHTIQDGGATFLRGTATDGHRMAVATRPVPAGAETMPGVIVPRAAVALMLAEMKRKGGSDTVTVEVSTTKALFMVGDMILTTKLIDGTFPDYGRVVPAGNPGAIRFRDASELAEAIKGVSLISSERGRAVKLEIDAEPAGAMNVRLSVNNPDQGSATDDVTGYEYGDGHALTIGFNSTYLLDILAECGTEGVMMRYADPGSPTRFEPETHEDPARSCFYVLMPLRV